MRKLFIVTIIFMLSACIGINDTKDTVNIVVLWGSEPDSTAVSYEVLGSLNHGPFYKIGSTLRRDSTFVDGNKISGLLSTNIERGTLFAVKVRGVGKNGTLSAFSETTQVYVKEIQR